MVKSNPMVYKCILQQAQAAEGVSPERVQDVIDLVTDKGLLIRHPDGCFTINPMAKGHTETVRQVGSEPASARSLVAGKPSKFLNRKGRKRGGMARRTLRPWTVASRPNFGRTKTKRATRRGPRKSRSKTRSGARRRQRKPAHKNLRLKKRAHKRKTLKRFYSVMRRLTDSFTDLSKKTKKML